MRIIVLTLILFSSITAYSQTIDSEKVLDQTPNFIKGHIGISDSLFLKDIEILRHCGTLKDEDSLLFKGPILGTLLVKLAGENKRVSYKSILNELLKITEDPQYKKGLQLEELGSKKIDLSLWDETKSVLKELGLTDAELLTFKLFIIQNQLENLTYKQAYSLYINRQPKVTTQEEIVYQFKDLIDYTVALNDAKKSKKKLLLYFTAYGDINSRKIESNILRNQKVKSILDLNFVSYNAFTDDKTELPTALVYVSKLNGKKITTIGKKFSEFQIEKFQNNSQPYFVIIDMNEKIRAQIGYVTYINDFIDFLNAN
jgi:hypothetical protein